MEIFKDNVKLKLTYEEQKTLNDFYMMMEFEPPFNDWSSMNICDFLEFISEKFRERIPSEEVFVKNGITVDIINAPN